MAAQVISGKEIAAQLRAKVARQAKDEGLTPGLAVVLVGEDPASQVYVRNKERACNEAGFLSQVHRLPGDTTQDELLQLIADLAANTAIHGILVQLPLPGQIDEQEVLLAIPPEKDVDGFHPVNAGKLLLGQEGFVACTPAGVIELIDSTGIDITGKHCVVIGRSNIVGKPVALLMLARNATVTVCHSRTQNLSEICASADILIAAVGIAGFVTADMVKPGAVVIDVGINRDEEGKLCGDVDYLPAAQKAAFITPVPGGVGPMTIAELLQNTLISARRAKANGQ